MSHYPTKTEIDGKEYYQISTASNLYWFADKVNSISPSESSKINAVFTADIVLNKGEINQNTTEAVFWNQIGNFRGEDEPKEEEEKPKGYNGIFDGKNHKISGLYFNDNEKDEVGLFSTLGDGKTIIITILNEFYKK